LICFCDHKGDCDLYRANFDAICTAIASAVTGITAPVLGPEPEPPEPPEPTDMPVVTLTVDPLGSAKVVVIGAADVLSA
jgi:hypothetical protein